MLALDSGDKIQGDTSTASKVDYTINGVVGTTLTQLADGQLPSSIGDLYTASANGVGIASITLVNTNTSAETINLYLLPSGGTARRLIPKDLSLTAAYSLVFDGQKMQVFDTSGSIQYTTGAGAGGATTALDNLASVAINTSLVSDTDNTDDLGTAAKEWKDIYIDGTAYIDNIEIASGETITGDGTDLTLASGGDIALTATGDVNIPVNVGLEFAGTEKIESDGTDLSFTVGAGGDINIGANIGVTFGDDGEKIEGNGTDLTISGNNINLTAAADVVVPANIGVTFGSGEKIEGDNTDLTVTSGGDIALTATNDINVPANVGMTFGDDGEKIEGDGTDLTIASSGVLNLNSTGNLLASHQAIVDNHVVTVDDADAADNDYAKFTANGIEGREASEVVSDILSSFADQITGAHLSQTFGASSARLTNLIPTPISGEVLRISNCSGSCFNGVIDDNASAHGWQGLDDTHVPYDGDSEEDMFSGLSAYTGTTFWGQIILHNTTRSNSRKIVSVDRTNNVITTTSSTDDWADDDVITAESQTNAGSGAFEYFDIDLSVNVAATTTAILLGIRFQNNTATANTNNLIFVHPYEAYDTGKRQAIKCAAASEYSSSLMIVPMISQKFTMCVYNAGQDDFEVILTVVATVEYADT